MRFSTSRNSFSLMPDRAVNTDRLQPFDTAKSINARAAIAATVRSFIASPLAATGGHRFATPRHVDRSPSGLKYGQMTTAAKVSPRFMARAVGVLYLLMIAFGSI